MKSGEHFGKAFNRVTSPTKWADPLFAAKVGMDVAQAWANLPFDMERFSISLLEGSRHLGQFNGNVAMNLARIDWQNVRLAIQSGRATAGSQSVLTDQTIQLRDNLQPLKDAGTNFQQLFQAGIDKAINVYFDHTPAGRLLTRVANNFNNLVNKLTGEQNIERPPAAQFVETLSMLQNADALARRANRHRPQKD